MKNIDIFLNKLNTIAEDLEQLGREFENIFEEYNGADFENHTILAADKLDNLILAATHETASTIGFISNDIKILTDFINFRKANKKLTDKELEEIIDQPAISLELKLALSKKWVVDNIRQLPERIKTIQHTWNKEFNNKKFSYIRNKFLA